MLSYLWIVAVLLAASSQQVCAQYDDEEPSRFSIKIELFRPSGSKLRDQGDSLWRGFGASYALTPGKGRQPESYVSLDQMGVSEDLLEGKLTAVQYTLVWDKDEEKSRGPYYGVGTGLFIAKEKERPFVFAPWEEYSATKLGLSLLGGYSLGDSWYAELRYTMLGEVAAGADFSGFTISFGAKEVF